MHRNIIPIELSEDEIERTFSALLCKLEELKRNKAPQAWLNKYLGIAVYLNYALKENRANHRELEIFDQYKKVEN